MTATATEPVDQQTANQAVLQSIHHTHKALVGIQKLLEASILQLSVGGANMDRELENWPVPGLRRQVLSNRRVTGSDNFSATAAAALQVVEAMPGRLGGTIVNSGTNSALLYLVGSTHISAISGGNPAIFLAANGGSWDFRLGAVPWDGPVSVISAAGTTLTWVQF